MNWNKSFEQFQNKKTMPALKKNTLSSKIRSTNIFKNSKALSTQITSNTPLMGIHYTEQLSQIKKRKQQTIKVAKSISLPPTSLKNSSKLISTMDLLSSAQSDQKIINSTSQKQPKPITQWHHSKSKISVYPSPTDLSSIDPTTSMKT